MTCPVSTTPGRTDDELRCIAELTFFGITEVRFFFGLISFLFLFIFHCISVKITIENYLRISRVK